LHFAQLGATAPPLRSEFAKELRCHEGMAPLDAIRMAASIRVRPVTNAR
jgi:multidrug efflux pump subunit AcrB